MASFSEERLDVGVDYGVTGGPEYHTTIIVIGSGHEQRNEEWAASRGRWQLGERTITRDTLDMLQAFFRARRGKAQGFRWKDWGDYRAVNEALTLDGSPTLQLQKRYSSGADTYVRDIQKPVSGTVTLRRSGSAYTPASIDYTTGVVTLVADSSVNITGITNANPGVVTTGAAHGFATGDVVWIRDVLGMTEVNERVFTVTVVDATSFEIGEDTTSYGSYGGGGYVDKYPQPSDSMDWSGEFDVPVRFDTDVFSAEFLAVQQGTDEAAFHLASLPVVEIRL